MSGHYEAHGTRVTLPYEGGGFDVRKCPDPERLARSIADAMNHQREADDWPAQKEYLERQAANQKASATWAKNVLRGMRNKLINISLGVKREPDHASFESTNDADRFTSIVCELEKIEEWRIFDKGEPPRDWIAELEAANQTIASLRFVIDRGQRGERALEDQIETLERRNKHLLETNNRYLEKARSARRLVRRIRQAINLALKVEVIVDTFFMDDTSETVVDAIDAELADPITRY